MRQLSKEEKVKCYEHALKQLHEINGERFTCLSIKNKYYDLQDRSIHTEHSDVIMIRQFPEYFKLLNEELSKHDIDYESELVSGYGLESIAMIKNRVSKRKDEMIDKTLPIRERLLKAAIAMNS